jgi:hypothetical protein
MSRRGGGGPRYSDLDRRVIGWLRASYELLSLPVLVVFLLFNRRFDPAYRLGWWRKVRLVWRMHRNCRTIETGTSLRAHVAMAAKVFEVPADVPGVLVECGCWKGGTSTNLSLIASLCGRSLIVYDSFEGLPPPAPGDRWAHEVATGAFHGDLDLVRANITRGGAIQCCELRKGWFADTLPQHREPIIAAYVDVDYQQSLHECVLHLWPHLVPAGLFFIDEFTRLDYCALFFSERWWRANFDRPPPGLLGTGSGVGVGHFFVGPQRGKPPIQAPDSVAFTRKDFYGQWDYYPDAEVEVRPGGGDGDATTAAGWTLSSVSMAEREGRGPER